MEVKRQQSRRPTMLLRECWSICWMPQCNPLIASTFSKLEQIKPLTVGSNPCSQSDCSSAYLASSTPHQSNPAGDQNNASAGKGQGELEQWAPTTVEVWVPVGGSLGQQRTCHTLLLPCAQLSGARWGVTGVRLCSGHPSGVANNMCATVSQESRGSLDTG